MTLSSFLRFVPVRTTPCCPSRGSRDLVLHWNITSPCFFRSSRMDFAHEPLFNFSNVSLISWVLLLRLRMPTTPNRYPWCRSRCWESFWEITLYMQSAGTGLCTIIALDGFRLPTSQSLILCTGQFLSIKQHLGYVSNCCGSAPSMVLIDRFWVLLRLGCPQQGWVVWRRWVSSLLAFSSSSNESCLKDRVDVERNNLYGRQTLSNCRE